jgi:hypothetical protein
MLGPMNEPTPLTPELRAAQEAIESIEAGDTAAALKVLQTVLSHRGPPHSDDPDSRSKEVVWVRQQMQQVRQALNKYPDDSQFPLASLRKALAGPQPKSKSSRVVAAERIS